MPAVGRLRYLGLAYFAKPTQDRSLFRAVRKRRINRVLEIGIGSLPRALNLIGVCQRYSEQEQTHYSAVDWFEERQADETPLSLMQAHRALNATGAKVRISPGGPNAIEAVANALPATELILIGPEVTDQQLLPLWFFFPRMCCDQTLVLRAVKKGSDGTGDHLAMGLDEIDQLASTAQLQRRAA